MQHLVAIAGNLRCDHPARIPQARRRRPADVRQTPPVPRDTPTATPGASDTGTCGSMRRRIVALLREYLEGLLVREIEARLGIARSLSDTLLGMRRDGMVQRVERRRYAVGTS